MITRRYLLQTSAAGALAATVPSLASLAAAGASPVTRRIPVTGEAVPVVGMGTSRTFDVGTDAQARAGLVEVLKAFFDGGGTVIDSSPMYRSAEAVTGDLLRQLHPARVFVATKVWTDGRDAGIAQMNESLRKLGVSRMDLMQVHNLSDWQTQLATLREWKAAGRIRYIGITTSTARQYEDFAAVMRAEKLDFVQFNYSIGEREAEKTLLPLAQDKGIATLINRPFMRSELLSRVRDKPVPGWAAEIGCTSWAQLLLKWIIGHAAVTCVIPATANPVNMADNMRAGVGAMPDEIMRRRIAEAVGA